MKKLLFFLLSLFFFQINQGFCQKTELGIQFSYEEAWIENINSRGRLTITYLNKNKALVSDDFSISRQLLRDKKLRVGNKIAFKGEEFISNNKKNVTHIEVRNNLASDKKKTFKGRIEAVDGDILIVDGHRIKLTSRGKIKGKDGWKNQRFSVVGDLVLGGWAEVTGKRRNGITYANEIITFPRVTSEENRLKKELEIDKLEDWYSEVFFPDWNDEEKRKEWFGETLFGLSITNHDAVQKFVTKVGQKLVPDYMKSKMNFSFVVVDDESWNASMTPVGLCFVHTGLLNDIENEAQLAAVLGHEIGHAVYKHIIQEKGKEEEIQREQERKGKIIEFLGELDIPVNLPPEIEEKRKKIEEARKTIDQVLGNEQKGRRNEFDPIVLLNQQMKFNAKKHSFEYNQEQETQSDRVGLYYMVAAGYDPREAPKIWKKRHHSHPKTHHHEKGVNGMIDVISGKTTIQQEINESQARKGKKIFKSHPDDLKRFRDLNALISFYWSDENKLNSLSKGVIFKN